MSRQNQILQMITLATSLTLAGCSSSDGTSTSRPPTEADVQAAMQEVVLPAMDQLGLDPNSAAPVPAPGGPGAPAAAAQNCWDLSGLCSSHSGDYDFCSSKVDGITDWSWTYDDCGLPGGTHDGTWSLEFGNSAISSSFALSVGKLGLAGEVSYTKNGSCWTHAVDGFMASGPRHTVNIDGQALYCPSTRPVGHWELDVAGETSFHASFEFDASAGTLIVVDNEGTVHHCAIDFAAKKVTCEEE